MKEKYARDSKRPFCFECGRQLAYVNGVAVFTVRNHHGTDVKLHKACVKVFEKKV